MTASEQRFRCAMSPGAGRPSVPSELQGCPAFFAGLWLSTNFTSVPVRAPSKARTNRSSGGKSSGRGTCTSAPSTSIRMTRRRLVSVEEHIRGQKFQRTVSARSRRRSKSSSSSGATIMIVVPVRVSSRSGRPRAPASRRASSPSTGSIPPVRSARPHQWRPV